MLRLITLPEYLHVLLNPLPIYGVALSAFALLVALIARNRPCQVLSLVLMFLCSGSAVPVYVYGQRAYHRVYLVADGDGQVWLDRHRKTAEKLIYVFYGLAGLTLAALIVPKKFPRAATPMALASFLASLTTLGIAGAIAYPGGKILHPEFREPPPAAGSGQVP
jgi:uncharacterized membrane protein YjdF